MFITPVQQLQSRLPAQKSQAALFFSSTKPDRIRFGSVSNHPLMQRILNGDPVVMYHGQHDTSDAHLLLEKAINAKTSFEIDGNIVNIKGPDGKKRDYFVNAHHPLSYLLRLQKHPGSGHPQDIHPARYMDRIREAGLFTKFDFKSPKAISPLGELAQSMPADRQMAHAVYAPLDYRRLKLAPHKNAESFSTDQLAALRQQLGEDVPLLVSCRGLRENNLTDKLLADVAKKIKGKAQFVNFNLPGKQNIPVDFAQKAWTQYGIIAEVKIKSLNDYVTWDRADIPYLGVTDVPHLASRLG